MKAHVRKWAQLRWQELTAIGVYIILTLVMTWPLVGQLNTHLPGPGDDLLVHYWNGWWVKRVLTQGGDLFRTDLLFYPTGVSLLYHNISWYNIALWLPLEPLVGGIAAFNLVYLLNLFLCAVGMYILARYLTRSTGGAFIAGLVYAFWPYRLFEIDHPNLIATQWLPLFLFYMMRVVREERKFRHAVIAAVFLVLTGYTRWQLLVFAAFVACGYVLYSLCFERRCWGICVVVALGMVAVIAVALMAPSLYPLLRAQLTRTYPEDLFVESLVAKQTDVLAYVVPPHNHLLEGLFGELEYADGYTRAWYSNAYLGYFVILLIILGVPKAHRMTWLWMGMALVIWLLALGPALRINKHIYTNIPLPYVLVRDFLPIKVMREERRFNILLALPVAAMTAYGVTFLRDWVRRLNKVSTRYMPILFAGLTLLVCVDYLQIPVRTFDTEISPFYQSLAEEPERFALLNLPTGRDRSPYYMLCQTTHGKPIVEGSVARPPREAREFVESNPFLLYLRDNRMMNPKLPDVSRQLALLAKADVRYIILNELYAFPWEKDNWRTYLAYRPFYKDSFITVYRTDLQEGRDFNLSSELYDGLGVVKVISATAFIRPASLMEVAMVWGTVEPQHEDFEVELALVDESARPQQTVTFPLVPGWPTSEWPANALAHGRYAFRVDPRLPGGRYALTLTLVRPDTGERLGESVVIADSLDMPLQPRVFTRPSLQVEVDARFGDALQLLGYDLRQGDDELAVTLHWQALRRMDESYKFFVHLYEIESGELVTQADVVPRGWTYPTTWWEASEVVSDEVHLALSEVPSGRYQLAVGVYNPDTGERLAIVDQPARFVVDERRLILPEEVGR
jgi:hypothetical protein